MQLEVFSQGRSLLHILDPRVKLLVYLPFILLTALSNSLVQVPASLAAATTLAGIARIPGPRLFQRLAVVNFFMVFLWITLPFSISGDPLWNVGPLTVSREGVTLPLLITLKANAIALYTISLPGTSTIMSLSHAMLHLRVPGKLVTVFYFFYRYIGVIADEYSKMLRMLQAKGFHATTSIHTIKVYAFFTGMLFIKSHERSERVYNALLMRNFHGEFPLLAHFRLSQQDLIFSCSMSCLFLTIILL